MGGGDRFSKISKIVATLGKRSWYIAKTFNVGGGRGVENSKFKGKNRKYCRIPVNNSNSQHNSTQFAERENFELSSDFWLKGSIF